MPRPNRPRSIASEAALARRVAHEREARGMTPAGLASRMTQVGCPINASAIYKIEKADPPRRITVDELVAFAEVFGVTIEDLLLPPEVASDRALRELVLAWTAARVDVGPVIAREREAFANLAQYAADHPDVWPSLTELMQEWAANSLTDEERDRGFAIKMTQLTGDNSWLGVADGSISRLERDDEGNFVLRIKSGEDSA